MNQPRTARVVDAFGRVEKKLPGTIMFRPLSVGDRLAPETVLRTDAKGAALLELPDKHMVRVGAGTTLVLSKLGQDKEFALKVLSGQIWSLVRKVNQPAKFTVETTSGVAGVTGTFFAVGWDETSEEMVVSTGEGSVQVHLTDDKGQAQGEGVPIIEGMMTRLARRHRVRGGLPPGMPLGMTRVFRQGADHQRMWKLLYSEGAWAQQRGGGAFRINRRNEMLLLRYLRAQQLQNGAQPQGMGGPGVRHPGMIPPPGSRLGRGPRNR